MELSREQQIAFDKYVEGNNIFITGPGGVGKSALIKKIYEHANRRMKNICVTAMTGCAAVLLNCNAKTIHSWAGIGLGNSSVDILVRKIMRNKSCKSNWRKTDILIVDEVSMLSLKLFETLNNIGKLMRNCQKPFGGIQLIFSGDFYQLPPVGNKDDPDTIKFCFESNDWNSIFHRNCQIQLTKIYRQTDDIYANILNQIREGKIKKKTNELLLNHVGKKICNNSDANNVYIEPTKLYPTKNRVDSINNMKMDQLDSEIYEYNLTYMYNVESEKNKKNDEKNSEINFTPTEIKYELDTIASNILCDETLKLKVGAQVMCIINMQNECKKGVEICNGSQGVVIGFCEITKNPIVKFNNGIIMNMEKHVWKSDRIPGVGVSQIPLILAWALTIHKSQGSTLDVAEIDVGSGIFECGQTYVALSRVKSLDGLFLKSFDVSKIKINKKVKDFYESLTTYQQSMFEHEEIFVPLVIAEKS
jgi:ATP-dependent DNA helicase PIF1